MEACVMETTCNFNSCCPKAVTEVTVTTTNNYTTLNLFDGEGAVHLYEQKNFSGTEFWLPEVPLQGYAVKVFVNGLLQSYGVHYLVGADPKLILFSNALSTDDVQVEYASSVAPPTPVTPVQVLRHVVVLTGTTVVLPYVPGLGFPVVVYVNGVMQTEGGDYTISGDTITFNMALSGVVVQVLYAID